MSVIVLIGESANGKSTTEKVLNAKYHYNRTISYTTREPRMGEKDGVDYHFVTKDDFIEKMNENFFAEVGVYKGDYYGSTIDEYKDNTVCVLTPHGMRQIKKSLRDKFDVVTFYLKVDGRDRIIKALQRGDEINEVFRRYQSDVGMFDGVVDEVDYIIENSGYISDAEEIADYIVDIIYRRAYKEYKDE